jgi:hypothetical protein
MRRMHTQRMASTLMFGLLLLALFLGAILLAPSGATLLPDPMISP